MVDDMEIATFVVSTVALVISVLAARFAYRQANEARIVRRLEAGRRHDERTPKLAGRVEWASGTHLLVLKLESPQPLQQLEVEIINGEGFSFTRGANGVDPTAAAPMKATYAGTGSLAMGDEYRWRLDHSGPLPKTVTIKAVCHGADDHGGSATWTVLFDITDVGYDDMNSVL